jgi:hypothetical protein
MIHKTITIKIKQNYTLTIIDKKLNAWIIITQNIKFYALINFAKALNNLSLSVHIESLAENSYFARMLFMSLKSGLSNLLLIQIWDLFNRFLKNIKRSRS